MNWYVPIYTSVYHSQVYDKPRLRLCQVKIKVSLFSTICDRLACGILLSKRPLPDNVLTKTERERSFAGVFVSIIMKNVEDILNEVTSQYDELVSYADLYDSASIETKKMIVNCLINRVEVGRGYKLNIAFNFHLSQFFCGLDLSAIA